jgi:hypothetical protein
MKNDNGKIRVFEVDEFIKKLVEKNAIDKRDVMDYKKNPQELCEKLNNNEKGFGIKYNLV